MELVTKGSKNKKKLNHKIHSPYSSQYPLEVSLELE